MLVAAASAITAIVTAVFALRRSVLGRGQIATAALPETATSVAASAPEPAPSTTAGKVAAITPVAPIVSAVIAPVAAPAIVRGGTILRRIVGGRKIWRRRFIGFGLRFVVEDIGFGGAGEFRLNFFDAGSAGFCFLDMGVNFVRLGGAAGLGDFWRMRFLNAGESFARKRFDVSVAVGRSRWSMLVAVAMIVVFEIFENVADVKERVAIKTDVNESGLHAGKDAGNFAFVDTANEGEFLFALDVDFYELAFFQDGDSPFMGGRADNQFFRHENSLKVVPATPEAGRSAAPRSRGMKCNDATNLESNEATAEHTIDEAADASLPKERLFPVQLLRLARCQDAGRTADDAVLTANYQFGFESVRLPSLTVRFATRTWKTRTLTFFTKFFGARRMPGQNPDRFERRETHCHGSIDEAAEPDIHHQADG
jgi:hypothetical protein